MPHSPIPSTKLLNLSFQENLVCVNLTVKTRQHSGYRQNCMYAFFFNSREEPIFLSKSLLKSNLGNILSHHNQYQQVASLMIPSFCLHFFASLLCLQLVQLITSSLTLSPLFLLSEVFNYCRPYIIRNNIPISRTSNSCVPSHLKGRILPATLHN